MKLCDPLPCHLNSLCSNIVSPVNFIVIRYDKIITEYGHRQECAAKVASTILHIQCSVVICQPCFPELKRNHSDHPE
jgi:hypothetical protein